MSDILVVRIRVPFVLDTKAMEGKGPGYIKGYASTFGNVDQGDEIMKAGCFDRTCAEHESAGTMPHMFFNHSSNEPVGDWNKMKPDQHGLGVEGDQGPWLGKGIPKCEQSNMMMKSKGPKGLSVGFISRAASVDQATGIRTHEDVDLKEVSLVAFPMNTQAQAVAKALAEMTTVRDFEGGLRDVGMSSGEAKAFIAKLKVAMLLERDAEERKQAEFTQQLTKALDLSTLFKT